MDHFASRDRATTSLPPLATPQHLAGARTYRGYIEVVSKRSPLLWSHPMLTDLLVLQSTSQAHSDAPPIGGDAACAGCPEGIDQL